MNCLNKLRPIQGLDMIAQAMGDQWTRHRRRTDTQQPNEKTSASGVHRKTKKTIITYLQVLHPVFTWNPPDLVALGFLSARIGRDIDKEIFLKTAMPVTLGPKGVSAAGGSSFVMAKGALLESKGQDQIHELRAGQSTHWLHRESLLPSLCYINQCKVVHAAWAA